jgi:hypothetical protein
MKVNPFSKYLSVEDTEHIKVVNWIKDNLPDVIAFHVPNEGSKTPFERYKSSLMGILKGCPDFVILYPKHSENKTDSNGNVYRELLYNGLMIELKAPEHNRIVKKGKDAGKIVKSKGKLSPEQDVLLKKLNSIKYRAVCCFGADEAIREMRQYFENKLKKIK